MMDHERQERELQEVFEATQQAHRTLMEGTLALQKQTLDIARRLLESQAGSAQSDDRAALESLAEQSDKQREAMEALIREAAQDYLEVLRTPFSHHHQHHVGEDVAANEASPPKPRST